jgi:nucleoside 2-deoxyribosyltransferase
VYLAGPISGLSFEEATDWRHSAVAALGTVGIKCWSPLRGKEYLAQLEKISGHGNEYAHMGALATARGIMTRDRFDATRCDVLLANLLDYPRVSVGTVMEIAWADAHRIPVVACMEADGSNPHEHVMINEAIGFKVGTLADAFLVIKAILL